MNALQSPDQLLIAAELPVPTEATGGRSAGVRNRSSEGVQGLRPQPDQAGPPDRSEWVSAGHLARLVADLVENVLDLSPIYASYKESRGAPPYHPKLLVKLLLYGYAVGTVSSQRLERAAQELLPCRYLTADQLPDHWTISEFRRRVT